MGLVNPSTTGDDIEREHCLRVCRITSNLNSKGRSIPKCMNQVQCCLSQKATRRVIRLAGVYLDYTGRIGKFALQDGAGAKSVFISASYQ